MGNKYFYGAAVQGIQDFIFKTNKLTEIAGASEMVENICTNLFDKILKECQIKEGTTILQAAGNVKYIFNSRLDCEKVVRIFPKRVMEYAPGITISQAVVELSTDGMITAVQKLENRLRTQRNMPSTPLDLGLMAIERCRATGLPAIKKEDSKFVDFATLKKNEIYEKSKTSKELLRVANSFFGKDNYEIGSLPWDISDMQTKNSWIAVVHADGNDMGLKIQEVAKKEEYQSEEAYSKFFNGFSKAIDMATKKAAQKAYAEVDKPSHHPKIAFRPIIVGGDDLTFICKADLAIPFTKLFLKYFEEETKEAFNPLNERALKQGLCACAGIAFVKASHPFHYAYSLSEGLCKHAKKMAKGNKASESDLTPSCLHFHKVQDSLNMEYRDISERELNIDTKYSLQFGPYFLHENTCKDSSNKILFHTIEHLQKQVSCLLSDAKEGSAIKSHLRQILTDLHDNHEMAKQKVKRLISEKKENKNFKELGLAEMDENFGTVKITRMTKKNDGVKTIETLPFYDWLALYTIYQTEYQTEDLNSK